MFPKDAFSAGQTWIRAPAFDLDLSAEPGCERVGKTEVLGRKKTKLTPNDACGQLELESLMQSKNHAWRVHGV